LPPPPVSSPFRSLSPSAKPSWPSLRSPSSSYGRTLNFPTPNFAAARAAAAVAAGHRRTPPSVPSPPKRRAPTRPR
jgi:hypothetical protein